MGRTLQSSLQVWFANNTPDTPSTLAGQVAAMGGTRAAAQALIDAGLVHSAKAESQFKSAQRRVESYLAQERADAGLPAAKKQRHAPQDVRDLVREKAAQANAANTRDAIAKQGMQGKIEGTMKKSNFFEEREIDVEIDGEDLLDMLDAIERGAWGEATAEFNAAFFEAYNLDESFSWVDVDGFEMGIG